MSVQKKNLTVLFTPLDGWGHINCSHGLAEELLKRGHRVVFAVDKSFEGKLNVFGFEEELLVTPESDDGSKWFKLIEELSKVFESQDPIDIAIPIMSNAVMKMVDDIIELNGQYEDIVKRVNPDILIVDNYVNCPPITNSGRPWVWVYSAAPLALYHSDELPPRRSGYPSNDPDKTRWITFNQRVADAGKPIYDKLNQFCLSKGVSLPPGLLHPPSPYLNIYLYIEELDYCSEVKPLPLNFIRVENFIRTTNEKFEIPDNLVNRSGGLVFLSMGSFGCANLKLMTRLVSILAKSKHRFIVAKGPNEYNLPDNMWGQKFVPQMAILPVVDAVITHGGNNTVTEAFYFGKPMLVLPLFGDQYDNAQRMLEKGLGLRLHPFHCTEEELIGAVDKLIDDKRMAEKYQKIGQRIRNSNDKKKIADIIEKFV